METLYKEVSDASDIVGSTKKHRDLVASAIKVYQLLGHEVQEIDGINEEKTDLTIRSNHGEVWIARCETSESIDAESIRSFIVSCSIRGPHQLAIITTGKIRTDAKEYVEGHPIYLVDEGMLRDYLIRAEKRHIKRALAPVAIPEEVGFPHERPVEDTRVEPRTMKCPFCAEEVVAGSIVCEFCNRNLVVTAPLSPDGEEITEDVTPERMFSST